MTATQPPNTLPADEPDGETERGSDAGQRSARAAAIAFAVFVVAAFPIILFWLGTYHWFFRDDWFFIAGRDASVHDLFEPANAHWNTLPLLEYRALWHVFGIRSYLPYQAITVLLHLTAAVLLRVVMRRAGVRPWIATAAAAVFILFGPGSQNIVWAFQTGFDGSLVFGLTHLLLADHDGRIDRRDWLGLFAGLLGLMCSGISVSLVVAVGVATFLRRGWRVAAFHTAPLAAVYVTYTIVERPEQSPFGWPSVSAMWGWLRSSAGGAFEGVGHGALLGLALAALLVVGWTIALGQGRLSLLQGRLAGPAALLVGGVAFAVTTGLARWGFGDSAAKASRYLYLYAAFLLPALAVAAEAVAERWRYAAVPAVALLVLPIPWNATVFEDPVFNKGYMSAEKRVLLTASRMPFAGDVPRDVRPINDPFVPVPIGFLLDAQRDGKLPDDDVPITDRTINEMKVRLGVAQREDNVKPSNCRTLEGELDISPPRGELVRINSPVTISTHEGPARTSIRVVFRPTSGHALTIELPDLDLRLAPLDGNSTFELCS